MADHTTGELGILIQSIDEKLVELTKENISSHANLDANQKVTNGRVNNLEKELGVGTSEPKIPYLMKEAETNKERRVYQAGMLALILFMYPFIWFLIKSEFKHYDESVDQRITQRINSAIEENNNKHFEQ